jgi:choline dehydrogenase
MTSMEESYDYVVVGGGTAGCTLAARLSEDRTVTVCLIEAGGSGKSLYVDVPGAILMAQRSESLNWRFQSEPQPQLNGRRIGVPRGKGLGGSSLINGMVYFRGHPRDYDDWSKSGATGWSYREVLPYFCKSEHNEDFGNTIYHGSGGPVNVRSVRGPNPLNQSFIDALARLGYAARQDLNGEDSEGVSLRQLSIRGGTRETPARALLYPAMGRRNLTVLTDLRVTRVVLEGRRAVGVEAQANLRQRTLGQRTVRGRREVVLAAGSIQSPQLLLLSGIGDGEHLADVGVPLRHHLPGVGRNLHDHMASPVHMSMNHTASYGLSWRTIPRNLRHLAQYALFRSGPLSNNVFESAAFVKSLPGLDRPDLQLVLQTAKRPKPSFPFPLGHGFAISPVGLYPRSRGRLTLASADPLAAPRIDPNLLAYPADIQPLLRGIRLARQIFASAAFAGYRAMETEPGETAQSDDALIDYIRAQAYTVHHPVSTCRMGNDPDAVVDPQLRVVGLEGLRVADASVFPSIIGGNTHAAVVMVAEKAADLILGRPALVPISPEELAAA